MLKVDLYARWSPTAVRCPMLGKSEVESNWNMMAHGGAREGKWRGNWRMEWVASTLNITLELGVSSITIADMHTSAASIRRNWRPRRFKWTRPFRRKTKSGFCACAITFQTQTNDGYTWGQTAFISSYWCAIGMWRILELRIWKSPSSVVGIATCHSLDGPGFESR